MSLHIPPLRERGEAIPFLLRHFLARAAAENGQPVPEIASEAFERLLCYPWPGNVRELQNAVQRAVLLCRNNRICSSDLPAKIGGLDLADFSTNEAFAQRPTLEKVEGNYIQFVLTSVGGNRAEAARILGIDRNALSQTGSKRSVVLVTSQALRTGASLRPFGMLSTKTLES